MSGHLFVIAAPSGAGKTSLVRALCAADANIRVATSHTTRPPRPGEANGVDYHFVDRATFEAMEAAGKFLESALVFENAYGTSLAAVDAVFAGGGDVILEIDWQGAAIVRERSPGLTSIFVLPPSRNALKSRLEERGQDEPAVIARRLAQAIDDISRHTAFDHVIVNDEFDTALEELAEIIRATRAGIEVPKRDVAALVEQLIR